MHNVYMPNSVQSANVKALLQSSQMPINSSYTGTGIINANGLTIDNIRALCQRYNFESNLANYVIIGLAPAYNGTPPSAAQIAANCFFYAFFFWGPGEVYGHLNEENFGSTVISAWYNDINYSASTRRSCCEINFYYNNGWVPSHYVNYFNTTTNWIFSSTGLDFNNVDVYVIETSMPVNYNANPYDPSIQDEHIFTKDPNYYKMYAGVACDESSDYANYYYSTLTYKLQLRWQSLRTGTSYTMPLSGRLIYQAPAVLSPSSLNPVPFYTFACETNNTAPNARALRMPVGAYASTSDIPTAWNELTDYRAIIEIPLQDLVDYMNTITGGCTEQDCFTEIFCDFMDVNNTLIETKSCNYTSLYGEEDIDISGGTIQDPNGQPSIDDTNVYTDEIDLTVPTLTGTGVFNRCYVLDANGVNDLCDFLYNANDSVFDEIIDGVLTRGNPIESLIDLRLYPFDVRAFTGAGTAESIKFGRTDTEIIGTKLPHNANAVISLGSAVVPRYYNSFLDYQMTVKLYIPFCGVCDLPVDRVLNHTISIKLIVDYITGACTAVVFVDKLPLMYQPGVIGVSIPMTATNSAEFGKTIIGNLVTGAKAAASKDPAAAAEAVGSTASALWEGSHIQSVGSSSPQTALYQPKNAYLLMSIVTPPEGVYDTTYANNIGYACFMPMNQIGFMDGTGFVAFDNVKLDIPQATEAEKTELLQLLKAGVFM